MGGWWHWGGLCGVAGVRWFCVGRIALLQASILGRMHAVLGIVLVGKLSLTVARRSQCSERARDKTTRLTAHRLMATRTPPRPQSTAAARARTCMRAAAASVAAAEGPEARPPRVPSRMSATVALGTSCRRCCAPSSSRARYRIRSIGRGGCSYRGLTAACPPSPHTHVPTPGSHAPTHVP